MKRRIQPRSVRSVRRLSGWTRRTSITRSYSRGLGCSENSPSGLIARLAVGMIPIPDRDQTGVPHSRTVRECAVKQPCQGVLQQRAAFAGCPSSRGASAPVADCPHRFPEPPDCRAAQLLRMRKRDALGATLRRLRSDPSHPFPIVKH